MKYSPRETTLKALIECTMHINGTFSELEKKRPLSGVRDTQAGHHLDKEPRMNLSGRKRIRLEGPFPCSTLCGNAELGDNNQVQVALVLSLIHI